MMIRHGMTEEDGNRNEYMEDEGTICEDGDSDTNW